MDDKTKEYFLKKIKEKRIEVIKAKKFTKKKDWKEFRAKVNKEIDNA